MLPPQKRRRGFKRYPNRQNFFIDLLVSGIEFKTGKLADHHLIIGQCAAKHLMTGNHKMEGVGVPVLGQIADGIIFRINGFVIALRKGLPVSKRTEVVGIDMTLKSVLQCGLSGERNQVSALLQTFPIGLQ